MPDIEVPLLFRRKQRQTVESRAWLTDIVIQARTIAATAWLGQLELNRLTAEESSDSSAGSASGGSTRESGSTDGC